MQSNINFCNQFSVKELKSQKKKKKEKIEKKNLNFIKWIQSWIEWRIKNEWEWIVEINILRDISAIFFNFFFLFQRLRKVEQKTKNYEEKRMKLEFLQH